MLMPQPIAKVYIHAIFSTKNRDPVLAESWRDELFRVLSGTLNILGCHCLIVGGVADHIHILFQLDDSVAITGAIEKIKWTSSEWINQTRGLRLPFYWQNGYAAFSISQSDVESVREYIRGQSDYHAIQSFQDELREFFKRHEIKWDEANVWS